jgi:hypothetical protein
MSICKPILIGGLLCSLTGLCAAEPELSASGDTMVTSVKTSEVKCSHCVVKLSPNAETRISANRISVDRASGVMHLDGAVRITFKNGGELRSESVLVKTSANGSRELIGDEILFTKATLR